MKRIIAAVFLFAVCCSIEAFSQGEMEEMICSIPDKYLLRLIDCAYDKSPARYQKFADVVYQCVDEFYENNGKSDSFLLLMCNESIQDDDDVQNCLNKKEEKLGEPKQAEDEEFLAGVKQCLLSAK